MEDYDALLEMQNLGEIKVVAIIEDDEKFILDELLYLQNIELMPIRHGYDLSKFSTEYIKKTEKLFIYYYNGLNNFDNETLRLKKHFVHYRRTPMFAYVPSTEENKGLISIFQKLGINVCSDKKQILAIIRGENSNG